MKATPLSQNVPQRRQRNHAIPQQPGVIQCSDELNRLLSAAVVSKNFCRKLLASPPAAIAEGYCGYQFDLPEQESSLLATIRSVSLDDFARQLISGLTPHQNATESRQQEPGRAGELAYGMVPAAPMFGEELAARL